MYQAHFGLTAPLVAPGIASDARVYTGGNARERLERRLDAALERPDAVVLLCGPAGTGKTTLAARAVRTRATRLAFAWIPHAPRRPHDVLEQLLVEFGLTAEFKGRAALLRGWQQFLHEMAMTETSVCVLVEHADELGPGVLRALESLTAADPNGCPGANLILMSRTSLAPLLRRPELAGLSQRVGANLSLEPLDERETREFLELAFEACGGRLADVADADAVKALHTCSGGVIRVLGNLAERTLAAAAERELERVDAALVEAVAAELWPLSAAQRGAPPASAPDAALSSEPDVPLLTDAVETAEDPLVRDALASMRLTEPDRAALEADAPRSGDDDPLVQPEDTLAAFATADDSVDDASDIDEDVQSEAYEGVANALAFEDFSNLVAESVFGREELDALSQTLGVPNGSEPETETETRGRTRTGT